MLQPGLYTLMKTSKLWGSNEHPSIENVQEFANFDSEYLDNEIITSCEYMSIKLEVFLSV